MDRLLDDVRFLLLRDLEGLQRELALFPDEETVWVTRAGIANAAGNLVLHVAGNLQHFIGHRLGGLPYRRDRDREFGQRNGTRAELHVEVERAMHVVREVLPALDGSQLDATLKPLPGVQVSSRRFLLHLCTHTAFHLGQVGYLRRIVTADPSSTQSVSASRLE